MATLGAAVIGAVASNQAGNKAADAMKEGSRASAAQRKEADRLLQENITRLEAIGIPSMEAQRIALEDPQLAGSLIAQELGPSAMEGVTTDPRLAQAQMNALNTMQQMGEGMSESEKVEAMMLTRGSAAAEQARQKSILQNMAERGVGGSGMELAAQLSSSQAAAERDAMAKAQLSASSQDRALQAIMNSGQLGGSIRGQEFGEGTQKASAADRIAQFNASQRASTQQQNLQAAQRIEDMRAANRSQEEISNKALLGQDYDRRLGKAKDISNVQTGRANVLTGQAADTLKQSQASAAGQVKQGAALAGLIGAAGKAYDQYNTKTEDKDKPAGADGMIMPQPNQVQPGAPAPNANGGYADGGMTYEHGDIVPGEEYEGDRIDAKVNAGEMVINVEQQQRLMELLKGMRDPDELGNEDIVEPAGPIDMPQDMQADRWNGAGEMAPSEITTGLTGTPSTDDTPSSESIYMEDGGVVRGLTAQHAHEKKKVDQHKEDTKRSNARIKALETLMGK